MPRRPEFATIATLFARAIACVIVLASGCERGTYVLVDVDVAAGSPEVNELIVTAVDSDGDVATPTVHGSTPNLVFPGSFSLQLPDDQSGPLTLVVEARAEDSSLLDRRSTAVIVDAHSSAEVSIRLFDGGPCPGDGSGYLCDDFEGPLDLTRWTVIGDDSTVRIDGAHVHTGLGALHLTIPAVDLGGNATVGLRNTAAIAAAPHGMFWLRTWLYVPSAPLNFTGFLLLGRDSPAAEEFVALTSIDFSMAALDIGADSSVAPIFGRWTCYVWAIDLQETQEGSMTLSGPDLPVLGPITGMTQDTPPLTAVVLLDQVTGINPAQPPFDLWFDDMRLDNHPIDCTSP